MYEEFFLTGEPLTILQDLRKSEMPEEAFYAKYSRERFAQMKSAGLINLVTVVPPTSNDPEYPNGLYNVAIVVAGLDALERYKRFRRRERLRNAQFVITTVLSIAAVLKSFLS